MIIGNLIKLRAIEKEDLPLIAKWRSDPEVYHYLFENDPISLTQQEKWYENLLKSDTDKIFMISTKDDTPIGIIGLYKIDWRSKNAEWGFYIGDRKNRLGGYAPEAEYLLIEYAFEHLNLNKLWCRTFEFNKKVLSMHRSFNFKEEGTFRKHIYHNGKYEDVVFMGLLKEEFLEVKDKLEKLFNKLK